MQVLAVLFGSLLLYRAVGAAGVSLFSSWVVSARFALVTMFVFTAVSHFAPMRKDLIAMVPPSLPDRIYSSSRRAYWSWPVRPACSSIPHDSGRRAVSFC